uniref:hypothetical protein n=1 Tax=Janthinobacterium sp. TaxID=1871054 RepID=UPI00159A2AAA|nr:hypothetical protein [Janthinobacterium sp.]QJS06058.1 hypothetical protein [Janthinobacterium sp.]
MKNDTVQDLKTKVDQLEKTLLAITCINEIQMQNQCSGNPVVDPEHTVYLLDHLMEPTMYQVEALRVLIHSLQAEVATPG